VPSVLISGANRGIGLALARSYAADGWVVHACARDPDLATELRGVLGHVTLHRLDVTDAGEIAALKTALDGVPLDVVINNAGVFGGRGAGLGHLDPETWARVLQVNTIAPIKVAEALLGNVSASDRRTLAFISSRLASIGESGGGEYVYRSSKAALNAAARNLALDVAARGVRTLILSPGWVKTDMGGAGAALAPEDSARGLRGVIDAATDEMSGRFWNHDGSEIPW